MRSTGADLPVPAAGLRERAAGAAHAVLAAAAIGCALFVPIGKAPFNVFLAIGALAFVVLAIATPQRARDALREPIVLGALALLALYVASLAWTIGPMRLALEQLGSYKVLLLPLVFAPVLADARWRDRTLAALLVALGVVLAFSLVQSVWPLPFARSTLDPLVRDAFGRPVIDAAVFSDRIRQAIHLSLLLLWAGGVVLLHRVPARQRGALAVLAVLCAIDVLFLLAGRTGYLTVAAVLAYLAAVRFGARGLLAWAGAMVALIAAVAAGLPVVSARAATTLAEIRAWLGTGSALLESGVGNASGQRLAMWGHTLRMIADAPVLGHGVESYRELARAVQAVSGATTLELYHDPHNELLYVGVELGLVGVGLLLALLVLLWRRAGGFDRFWRWFVRGAIVLYGAAGLANGVLNVGWTGYFFGLLLALAAGRAADRGAARGEERAR